MIVGELFQEIFKGVTLDREKGGILYKSPIQCEYGDQNELIKWSASKNLAVDKTKYPLIWVDAPSYTEHVGLLTAPVRVILMNISLYSYSNNTRFEETFTQTMYPLVEVFKSRLETYLYSNVLGDRHTKYKQHDEPLWSITSKAFEKPSSGSATSDIVDAVVLDFTIELQKNCIITKK